MTVEKTTVEPEHVEGYVVPLGRQLRQSVALDGVGLVLRFRVAGDAVLLHVFGLGVARGGGAGSGGVRGGSLLRGLPA